MLKKNLVLGGVASVALAVAASPAFAESPRQTAFMADYQNQLNQHQNLVNEYNAKTQDYLSKITAAPVGTTTTVLSSTGPFAAPVAGTPAEQYRQLRDAYQKQLDDYQHRLNEYHANMQADVGHSMHEMHEHG